MPDDQNGQDAQNSQQSADVGKTPASADQWKMEELPPAVQDYIKGLRKEAKDHREAKEAKEREAAAAASAAEQKRLADAGQFEQLAKLKAEEAAKPYQTRVADLEKVIAETNAQLIQQIPESIRALVLPDLPADKLNAWLIKSLPALTRKSAPETDAGAGQGGSGAKPATAQTQAMADMAKQYGYDITPEALAATAKRIEEQRRRPPKKDED